MKAKHLFLITAVIMAAALAAGLYCRASYRDFNRMGAPLEEFMVGLLPDEFVEMQIGRMEKELPDSPLIAAVRCTKRTEFLFGGTAQEAEVLHVFQGEGLEEGVCIDIARAGSVIFYNTESSGLEKPSINMDFVNEMTPGKDYLVFLDHREARAKGSSEVYVTNDEFLMATVFCYEKTRSVPQEKSVNDVGLYAYYTDVKDSEFFIMSDEAAVWLEQFKERLFERYPREW